MDHFARRAGTEQSVHYLVLTDEGHGFSRTESIVTTYQAVDRFLDRYILCDHSVKLVD